MGVKEKINSIASLKSNIGFERIFLSCQNTLEWLLK